MEDIDWVNSLGKGINMARWDDEKFNMQVPADDIPCMTCRYKLEPVTVGDYTQDRAKYGKCKKYDFKPSGILWQGEACDKYEEET